jgi:hypothetical protein
MGYLELYVSLEPTEAIGLKFLFLELNFYILMLGQPPLLGSSNKFTSDSTETIATPESRIY